MHDVMQYMKQHQNATIALFQKAQALAGELGGCGDGLHTFAEYVEVESLPERAALMVRMLQEL